MVGYQVSVEQRKKYRDAEVKKHGLEILNRKQELRRALKKGNVTPFILAKYQFSSDELPFLKEEEELASYESS